jgi:lysophospholipase L1-like esterase
MIRSRRATRAIAWLVATTIALGACVGRSSVAAPDQGHWVGSWEAPPQRVEPANMPPAPGLSGNTLRQVIHLSLGGSRWRLRISNEFGDGPLTIDAAHVARSANADTIDVASDARVTFDGNASLTIPAGRAVMSDPIDIAIAPLSEMVVTIRVGAAPAGLTGHPGSRTTSYLSASHGVADRTMTGAARTDHWYLISSAEVMAPASAAAVVILGNSIADGRGSGTNRNDRWPDNLARRLLADARTAQVAVLNAGIGGNAVVRGGLGPTALDRVERDVFSQAGVRWLIVSEGVNDIGGSRPDSAMATASHLIDAYGVIIRRARAAGVRVYGATMLPFTGSQYGSAPHEAARQRLNSWIRESRAFDAVIDLDAAMRDPADPSRLLPAADGGDHLHPNQHGYQMMAAAIDLGLFIDARK